jgi:hypothetical protein
MWNTSIWMNAECYWNGNGVLRVKLRVPVNWETKRNETKRNETKTKSNEICKVRKRCLQRINVYFVLIFVLLYRIRSFFSFDIVFLLYRFHQIENTEMWNTSIWMNAECYCNFQSNFNIGSCASCFVTIGEKRTNSVK